MPTTHPSPISCGADFCGGARRAAAVAAAPALRLGARLQLVHVVDDLGAEPMVEASMDTGARPAREQLTARLLTDTSARRVVTVLEVVDATDLVDALVQLGGRTGISPAILGSVGPQVVRQARGPVVLSSPHCTPQAVSLVL